MRLSYPTNIKIVKVPCTGRVDIILMMKAFENGADGVYLVGCMEGDCHYLTGNLKARKRVEYVKKLLDECGIGGRAGSHVQSVFSARTAFCRSGAGDDGKDKGAGTKPQQAPWRLKRP